MNAGQLPDLTPLHSLAEEVTGKPDRLCREALSADYPSFWCRGLV
jgi:hypothetical protein